MIAMALAGTRTRITDTSSSSGASSSTAASAAKIKPVNSKLFYSSHHRHQLYLPTCKSSTRSNSQSTTPTEFCLYRTNYPHTKL